MSEQGWASPDQSLVGLVNDFHAKCVEVYKQDSNRVHEDAGKERGIAEGGYGRKQIQELVQNSADALRASPGRIQVTLTEDTLYVANEGSPFESSGVRALLYTHLSNKTGGEIGRFGLGFKSISGISDSPQIFSQTVSFEFNRDATARELTDQTGDQLDAQSVPALRLAWVLDDPRQEMHADQVLASLSSWAVTIVKIPLKPGMARHLSEEISEFDESFNLFAPHVKQLDLRDDYAGTSRGFAASKRGNTVLLKSEEGEREWLVFSRDYRPSVAALESAGHSARRESVTVSWAVPKTGKGLGQLSAFFPVKSDTTLSGRINAPWKLSDDRINVIECAFNFEILAEVLPKLVVDARKDLVADGNFGRYIDVLPARGREERSWADGVLNEPVYQALRDSRCLPDLDGQLKSPGSLKRVPSELVGDYSQEWLEVTGERENWVHPECTVNIERRSKVDRLMQDNKQRVGRVLEWLQAVVATPDHKHSAAAIEIAAKVQGINDGTRLDVRDSRIVLLENGRLQQPVSGRCFIRTDAEQSAAAFIDSEVSTRPQTRAALEQLGITTFDSGGEMLQLLADLASGRAVDWDHLWIAMRGSGESNVRDAFDRTLQGRASSVIRVRDGRGEWVLPDGLYLAGDCLKQLKDDDRQLVDGNYHAADAEVLALLGIRTRPARGWSSHREKWVGKYLNDLKSAVGENMQLGLSARERLTVEGLDSLLGPLRLLPELSVTNRSALSVAVINSLHDPRVRVTHPQVTRAGRFICPELWWVKEHGYLPTVLGAVPIQDAFVDTANVGEFEGLLPTVVGVDLSEETGKVLGLRSEISSLNGPAFEQLVRTHVGRDDVERVGRAYAWWCHTHQEDPPAKMWVRRANQWAEMPRDEVAIASSREAQRDLDEFGIPSVLVDSPEDGYNLRELWGCMEGRALPLTYSYETSAEPVGIVDAFDIFDELEMDDDPEDLTLQKCLSISKIALIPGRPEMRVECTQAREGNTLLVTGSSDRFVLKQLLACLEMDDSDEQVDAFLDGIQRKRDPKQLRQSRQAATDEERILLFAGEERLKALIPRDALEQISKSYAEPPNGLELTRLCTTMLGPRTLERVCKVDPQTLPVTPPSTWHGSYQTRKWVRDLGFSEDWAGVKSPRRNKPTEYVDGPTNLSPFHDYQEAVSNRLLGMLIGDGPNRGIVSLPTGAGKTRVAVQTIIYAIRGGALDKGDSDLSGPILWLTDGEELCEQAIEAWSYLWRAEGRHDSQLILSRFWSNYETVEETGGVQVVVATWQKISSRAVDNPDFAWLAECPLVVIDEAHGALHRSYTKILEWSGRSTQQRDKPLLGLTATPFRGRRDSDETKRLLRRFDDNLLDEGVFGDEIPQVRLQRDRVLARATLEILDGVSVDLTDQELEEFRTKYWMPRNAERRLGRIGERTQMIVESILSKPEEWPIVVFAASVENAQTLATLLTLAGRPAASIDQDTSPDDRRLAIDRFKSGELRVLTNYAVLSQGFDAPETRAVYITRPTSSEVRYQQMVGRGLRGPRNGGGEEVLIVNVLDNVVEFHDSIVFESLKEIIDAGEPESDAVSA